MQDFTNEVIYTLLLPMLLGLIGIVIARAGAAFTKKTGVEIDASMSAAMHAAIERYVRAALAKAGYEPGPRREPSPDLTKAVVSGATDYLEKMNPETVRHFGLDKYKIGELVTKHILSVK